MRRFADLLLTLVAIIVVWSVAIQWFKVPNYILPTPTAVLHALKVGYIDGVYIPHFWATFKATVLGYLLGCSLAFVVGSFAADSRNFERFIYPYIVGLQSMPKVALAPLIIVWFGFGVASKVVVIALICFFPLFINTIVGIRQTDPNLIDLLKVFSASKLHVFLNVKLPAAAGHIFAGLEIAVVLSLIGAIVAEFVGSQHGLGNVIQAASQNLDVAAMFAVLLSLAVLGISGTAFVRWLHRRLVFWERRSEVALVAEH